MFFVRRIDRKKKEREREKKPLHSKGQKERRKKKKCSRWNNFGGGEKLGLPNKMEVSGAKKNIKKVLTKCGE